MFAPPPPKSVNQTVCIQSQDFERKETVDLAVCSTDILQINASSKIIFFMKLWPRLSWREHV